MISTTLIVILVFIGVFGGATIKWWLGGGYKTWLKYQHDVYMEKKRLDLDKEKGKGK